MNLKYPIILVHGIAVQERKKFMNIHLWGRIPETLREQGIKVFFGKTDAWGTYDSNALLLKATIEKVLEKTKSEKVNIIAHSKGGLDARYLIWKCHFGDKVASLTTISTPNGGAEVADLLHKQKALHSNLAKKALKKMEKLYGDISPNAYLVNEELTTEKMKEFNAKVIMDKTVYCQSIYSTMRNSFDDLVFFYPHSYIHKVAGANDGLVSEQSAQWGQKTVKINGGISHTEIIDFKQKNISGINIPELYLNIIENLSQMGF